MKRVFLLVTAIAGLSSGLASAQVDYIKIDRSQLVQNNWGAQIPFLITHQSATPSLINQGCNAFMITSTGDATWSIQGGTGNSSPWFDLGRIMFECIECDGVSPDIFAIQIVGMPGEGIPNVEDELLFTVYLQTGLGSGQICIDSCSLPPSCDWGWSGTDGSVVPKLVDAQGSDIHPICITMLDVVCGDADGSGGADIDDVAYLIAYIFTSGPAPVPYVCVGDVNGMDGVDIDDVVEMLAYIFTGGPPPYQYCCDM
ncbi:MAG: hypothetical protein KKG33_12165 [candidate division Zixibacteria bacterium]|nr:hypothetical protein [candidate division Zixibacteria bacterium]MBU1471658.1 hypothetical protein [candidate division Zixibacteria bacterium]MBU2626304.1 hypothetical protein [candidate division Zixibacteria bacterium]